MKKRQACPREFRRGEKRDEGVAVFMDGGKLAAVLTGGAPDKLLDSNEAERIGFARRLVATTDRVFSFATAGFNPKAPNAVGIRSLELIRHLVETGLHTWLVDAR
jgi:hypothetical protein